MVGHNSALEYWRCVGPRFLGTPRQRHSATLKAQRILTSAAKPKLAGGNRRPAGCQLPLHVMVGSNAARTRTRSIVSHTCEGGGYANKMPSSFVEAGGDFLIASPELCFAQLSPSLTVGQLVQLGFELCGTYALRLDAPALNRDEPLTSAAKLSAYLQKFNNFPGHKKAQRAAHYILDGSASPMETLLAMLLTLPYAMGGYGIPSPQLNFKVDVPPSKRNRADRASCVCDLCWQEHKLCLEYDSARYHLDPVQQESDARRRNVLATLGYTVITVSPRQLLDSGAFNRLAHQVAGYMGKRLRYSDPKFTHTHLAVRSELISDNPAPLET